MTDAESLARLLWMIGRGNPDHYIEVRSMGGGKVRAWDFVPCDQRAEVQRVVRAHMARRLDVYVGCAPRTIKGKGGRSSVPYSWAVWADCDTPESVRRLAQFHIKPTMAILSGSDFNVHAWWALDEPVSTDTVEDFNRRLSHALGSATKVSKTGKKERNAVEDAARVLRVPGTLNHKHVPPRRVRAVEFRAGLLSTQPFAALPSVPFEGPGARSAPLRGPRTVDRTDSLRSLAAADYVGRLLGRDLRANDKTPCPFHGDGPEDGGSLHLYPGDRGWHCFGCGKGGTVYDFGHHLWNLSTRGEQFTELRERLMQELGLTQ